MDSEYSDDSLSDLDTSFYGSWSCQLIPETGEQIIEVLATEVPESEISVEISSEPLYCICQEPWDILNRRFMIHCDHCSEWFHGSCIGITDGEARDIEKYHCPKCVLTVGPSISRELSSEATGKRVKSLRCTPEFIAKLKESKCFIPDEVILKMRGQALTLPWLITKGFNRPIFIETIDGLGMKVPPDSFSVRDVERNVGSDRMVDVIDVERQSDILMSMREFTEYFTSVSRTKLLNLISLEFSYTHLNKLVEAPYIARKLDWVSNYWPSIQSGPDEDSFQRPAVSKYCLISAKDSYTDFHIDFGGSSVWYHVLWGEKVFYLIEPSEVNLSIYHRWMDGEMGDQCFLGDEVEVCFKCTLKKGQTLLIPTGWIHAVYTPEDSLVFGGNFLHHLNMDLQLQVYGMEKQMKIPTKYLFPSFEATHWYAASGLIQDLQNLNSTSYLPAYLIKGLKSLIDVLKMWFSEKDVGKIRREDIPGKINCKKIIQDLIRVLRLSEKRGVTSSKKDGVKDEISPVASKVKVASRKESISTENGYSVTSSREGSPTSGTCKDSLKLLISRTSNANCREVPSTSPPYLRHNSAVSHCGQGSIKLKFKKQPSTGLTSGEDSPSNSPLDSKESRGVKIRLSLSEGKAESIDCDSNAGSDALHIVESDLDEHRFDTDASMHSSEGLVGDVGRQKTHRRHHHKNKKSKKDKPGKLKHSREQNKAINDVLGATLNGLEELFKSSNYTEKISQDESTPQTVKDAVADMDAMKNTILPPTKRNKHKKDNRRGDSGDFVDGLEKVHQDDDYIYLSLTGSDDESSSKRGKGKRGRRKEDDESWSPRAKVGPVGNRESKSSRVGAKRQAVEKGLEKAAASLENAKHKRKSKDEPGHKKSKKPKLVPSHDSLLSSPLSSKGSSSLDIAAKTSMLAKKFSSASPITTTTTPAQKKKPKKGMATAKQRLGKILKINKFARF